MHLKIHEYKGLKNVEVPLEGIVRVGGAPASGRSTLADAFRALVKPGSPGDIELVGVARRQNGSFRYPGGLNDPTRLMTEHFKMPYWAGYPDTEVRSYEDLQAFGKDWFYEGWKERLLRAADHARAATIFEGLGHEPLFFKGKLATRLEELHRRESKVYTRIVTFPEDGPSPELVVLTSDQDHLREEIRGTERLSASLDKEPVASESTTWLWEAIVEDASSFLGHRVTKGMGGTIYVGRLELAELSTSELETWDVLVKAHCLSHIQFPFLFLDLGGSPSPVGAGPLYGEAFEKWLAGLSGAFRGIILLRPETVPSRKTDLFLAGGTVSSEVDTESALRWR